MAFKEINAATGKTWTRDELFLALQESERKFETLAKFTEAQAKQERFIPWTDQLGNLKARWERHSDEFGLAKHDAMQLGLEARKWFEQIRSELSQPVLKS